MSDTTIINSKAIQNLLAQSESQLGQTSGPGGGAKGTSFHQLLEKAVNDNASDFTSHPALAASALTARSSSGTSAQRFTQALTGARHPNATPASKQLPLRGPKVSNTGASTGLKNGPASAARGARQASDPTAAADGLPDADDGDASPTLDATQTKVVNAPALPERPPSTARDLAQQAQARGATEGGPKGSSTGGQEPAVAGASNPTVGPGPRGFAAVLASSHLSASVPTSLVDQASFDPSLQMTITPQTAQLSLDTGEAGALTAQLQITNGVADVHMTGEAASVLARHGAELSLGLTAAGLQPGRVEITPSSAAADLSSATSDGSGAGSFPGEPGPGDDSNPQPQQQSARDSKPAPGSTLSARTSRVHVKA